MTSIKELEDQYNTLRKWLFLGSLMIASVLYRTFLPYISNNLPPTEGKILAGIIASTTLWGAIYGAILYCFENYIWKWLPNNQRYRLDGKWTLIKKKDGLEIHRGTASIHQTATKLEIGGASFQSTWKIECMRIEGDSGYIGFKAHLVKDAKNTFGDLVGFGVMTIHREIGQSHRMPKEISFQCTEVDTRGPQVETIAITYIRNDAPRKVRRYRFLWRLLLWRRKTAWTRDRVA